MALDYLPEWAPIPITTEMNNKRPLVRGVTGRKPIYPNRTLALSWMPEYGERGIGLRLPVNVIGIDVDMYGDKVGERTLALLQAKWGGLDPTWMTSSRLDGSGIRLYRVPTEYVENVTRWRDPRGAFGDGTPLGGLELVRWCHRFITVYPTRHGREGNPLYLWFNPDGIADDERIAWPFPEELPLLPEGWCAGLDGGRDYAPGSTTLDGSPSEWLKARPGGEAEPCSVMRRDLDRAVAAVAEAGRIGGCYPAASRGGLALIGNAAEGHSGGFPAVLALWKAYRRAMAGRSEGRRPPQIVDKEFGNCLRGAIEKLPANKFSDEDPCELFDRAGWGK